MALTRASDGSNAGLQPMSRGLWALVASLLVSCWGESHSVYESGTCTGLRRCLALSIHPRAEESLVAQFVGCNEAVADHLAVTADGGRISARCFDRETAIVASIEVENMQWVSGAATPTCGLGDSGDAEGRFTGRLDIHFQGERPQGVAARVAVPLEGRLAFHSRECQVSVDLSGVLIAPTEDGDGVWFDGALVTAAAFAE